MEKLTSKGKRTIKVENHPHTNIISKPVIIRGQEYKCRIFEMYLKLRDQQLKRKKKKKTVEINSWVPVVNEEAEVGG